MCRVTYLTWNYFQEVAYTGEYTLEAFSEFLEEQRKMKAEPGEKVSIWCSHCCVIQTGSELVQTFLTWLQPFLSLCWGVLNQIAAGSILTAAAVMYHSLAGTHPLTSLFLSHKTFISLGSCYPWVTPSALAASTAWHRGACTLAGVQQHLVMILAGKNSPAKCQL